jgi:uncharacterized OB-fold protein
LEHAAFDFQSSLNQQRLVGIRCQVCGALSFPPRNFCPRCLDRGPLPHEFSGLGILAAFTVISVGLSGMSARGFDAAHPYCSGVIQLAEGPSVCARVAGVDCSRPEELHVGMPVKAFFVEEGPQGVHLEFRPIPHMEPGGKNGL